MSAVLDDGVGALHWRLAAEVCHSLLGHDDVHVMFGVVNSMSDFIGAKEEVLSVESTPNRVTVKTKVTGRKQAFMVTDTYEGSADGIVVTSRLRPIYGLGDVPRASASTEALRMFPTTDATASPIPT